MLTGEGAGGSAWWPTAARATSLRFATTGVERPGLMARPLVGLAASVGLTPRLTAAAAGALAPPARYASTNPRATPSPRCIRPGDAHVGAIVGISSARSTSSTTCAAPTSPSLPPQSPTLTDDTVCTIAGGRCVLARAAARPCVRLVHPLPRPRLRRALRRMAALARPRAYQSFGANMRPCA